MHTTNLNINEYYLLMCHVFHLKISLRQGPRSKGFYVQRYYYQETEVLQCPKSVQYKVTYVETRK